MWIRSQDNMTLTEMKELDIDGANQIWSGALLIGKYSTEEKALKVLNEIQELIYFKADESGVTYQMPKDEDVE